MTLPDELARTVIQHFVVHDGEVGDIVWPLPEARRVVELWLRAAGDAVTCAHRTANEAHAADWRVFDTDPADPRPLFVVVDGLAPASPELSDAIAAASEGLAQPVLLLEDRPDNPWQTGSTPQDGASPTHANAWPQTPDREQPSSARQRVLAHHDTWLLRALCPPTTPLPSRSTRAHADDSDRPTGRYVETWRGD